MGIEYVLGQGQAIADTICVLALTIYKAIPQAFSLDVGETAMLFNTHCFLGTRRPILWGGCFYR